MKPQRSTAAPASHAKAPKRPAKPPEPEMTTAEAEKDLADRKRKFFEHWPVG